nr:MAG TPA: hypothetical protein [Caudoviricetes sp.]
MAGITLSCCASTATTLCTARGWTVSAALMMRVIPSPLLTMNGAEMPLLSVCHPPRVRNCLPQKSTPGAGLRVKRTPHAKGV